MKLRELTASISNDIREEATTLLESGIYVSFGESDEGYELLVIDGGVSLLPMIELDSDDTVIAFECQCEDGGRICVHIAALLLMIEQCRRS